MTEPVIETTADEALTDFTDELSDEALEIGVSAHQVGRHLGSAGLILAGEHDVHELGLGVLL